MLSPHQKVSGLFFFISSWFNNKIKRREKIQRILTSDTIELSNKINFNNDLHITVKQINFMTFKTERII